LYAPQASFAIRRICAELKSTRVVERVSPGYRLAKKGVKILEFHVTKVTGKRATLLRHLGPLMATCVAASRPPNMYFDSIFSFLPR
jgi:hypothetical protein